VVIDDLMFFRASHALVG